MVKLRGNLRMDKVTMIKSASYIAAALCMGLGAIGPAAGVGLAGGGGVRSSARQPKQSGLLLRNMLIGQAVTETTGIFALVVALIYIFTIPTDLVSDYSVYAVYTLVVAYIGGGLAMGLSAVGSGVGNGFVTVEANNAISKIPARSNRVLITMFIGQALSQTPAIFGLMVALFLKFRIGVNYGAIQSANDALIQGAKLMGAGIAMGAGAIGPAIGISLVGAVAAKQTGRYVENRTVILRTMFIGAAVTESTSIYSFVIALLLLFT